MKEDVRRKIERTESELRLLEEMGREHRLAKERLAAKTRLETLKEIEE